MLSSRQVDQTSINGLLCFHRDEFVPARFERSSRLGLAHRDTGPPTDEQRQTQHKYGEEFTATTLVRPRSVRTAEFATTVGRGTVERQSERFRRVRRDPRTNNVVEGIHGPLSESAGRGFYGYRFVVL